MATEYIADICRKLQIKFQGLNLHRPMRISRYDAGTELVYEVTDLDLKANKPNTAKVHLLVERFIGGGFAGQVYRVKILKFSPQRPLRTQRKNKVIFPQRSLRTLR